MNRDIFRTRNQDSVSPVVAVSLDFANLTAVQCIDIEHLMETKNNIGISFVIVY